MSSYVSNSISGGISFNGIGSGTDFDSMIAALKAVEEIPSQRMTLWKGEWEYRVAAMEEVLLVMGEAKTALADFNSMSKMMDIQVDTSKKEVATATINSDSDLSEGNYSINVKQVAHANLFSTKDSFKEKKSIINDTDADQEFSYTYQGTTRTIVVPPGTNLEQLVSRVNNDAQNPGVRASLIKDGNEYRFQMQGNDTGLDSKLSISSSIDGFDNDMLFTADNARINNTGDSQKFSMFYGNKSIENMNIPEDMTAGGFVEAFNTNPDNPGVTAAFVRQGSDYVIEYRDKKTKTLINPPTASKVPALGGSVGFDSANANINDSLEPKNYTYSYAGKNYTVPVAQNLTLQGLVDTINAPDANTPEGLTASIKEVDGKFSIEMTANDAVLLAEGEDTAHFVYIKDNVGQKFTVEPGTTMDEFVNEFNALNLGITAEAITDSGPPPTKKLQYKDGYNNLIVPNIMGELAPGSAPDAIIPSLPAITDGVACETALTIHDGGSASTLPGLGEKALVSGKDTIVNDTNADQPYTFEYPAGTEYTVNVSAGMTLAEFETEFNNTVPGSANIQAKIITSASGYSLGFVDDTGAEVKPTKIVTDMEFLQSGGDNWHEQEPQDAIFSLNGWDLDMTSSSNTLKESIGGMTITIKSEGETQLSVSSDSSILEENITLIVDALNLVKGTILKLQEVDADKQVSNPSAETDEDGNPKMSSQFTWQSGSALTGNYGVQMLLSQFSSITSSSAYGFTGMTHEDDTLNDPFTAFSHLGISTVTNPGEDDFGLLTIDYDKLNEAIDKDAVAVAELFSAQLSGTTNSSDFDVASAGTAAKAGTYDVKYTVDENGSVTNVLINGAEALNDPAYPGRFTVAEAGNDALGVALQFNTSGLQKGTHESEIRIKQGKVNEMIGFLGDELVRTSLDGEPQGTLPTIISNYNDIAKNLQKKVDDEAKRISVWEQRKKLEFARLDALLGEYDGKMKQVASMMPTGNQ